MTNIERLARELYAMQHRDRIMQALPSILFNRAQDASKQQEGGADNDGQRRV